MTTDHDSLNALIEIHIAVDSEVAALESRHRARMNCRKGCADCCVDDITVFEVEASRIRRGAASVLAEEPGSPGACAFLGPDKGCRIYEHRPYVCRTQGLPLRWIVETETGTLAEHRDICPLNDGAPDIVTLPAEDCWLLGPFEGRLHELQVSASNEPTRIALRALFTRGHEQDA